MAIRVLVADDQDMVRAGFAMILDAQDDIEVVGEAEDGEQAVAEAIRLSPDVLVMDIQMPTLDGIGATRAVLAQIIMDEESRGATMLPVNFLRQLIGLYGGQMQGLVPQYLEASLDTLQRNQAQLRETLAGAFTANPFADLARRKKVPASLLKALPPPSEYAGVRFASPAQLSKAKALIAAQWGPKVLGQ